MKVGILTHYTVVNQGAVLQMYALDRWLKEHNHDVRILTYSKNFDFDSTEKKRYSLSIKNYPFYFKEYVLKKGIGLAWFNVKKQLLYKRFNQNHFIYENYATWHSDATVVGSDEVFSLAVGCNMMMYGHAVNTDTLIAYAPSFGQTNLDRIEQYNCKELIRSGLMKFSALSVRDENSANIVEVLTGKRPELVCDPVLLYDFLNTHVSIKKLRKPYLLLYSYDRWMIDEKEIQAIKEYAKKKQLIIASIGTYHKWCDVNIVCDPLEWIEYYRGADEVITDTFHGAVLSIITNRKTAYFIRSLNSNKLLNLLTIFGLQNRILDEIDVNKIENIQNENVDFNKINDKLKEYRASSEEFLNKYFN